MDIIDRILQKESWEEFLEHKKCHGHLERGEEAEWRAFIEAERFRELPVAGELPLPVRKEINKSGSDKKRVIYSYPEPFNSILKGIAFQLYRYDDLFEDSCYAFRRNKSAADALKRLTQLNGDAKCWCLKADISNYFNSIDTGRLLDSLVFLRAEDERLFQLFRELLLKDKVEDAEGNVFVEQHGAMAGIPVAPFFANVYLSDLDRLFDKERYFRYSDDLLLLADSEAELYALRDRLFTALEEHRLKLNEKKLHVYAPAEAVEYLGFSVCGKEVDLSDSTKEKLKGKIRRKARALRRWSEEKKLPGERGAKGFIRAMNRKLFSAEGKEFSWSRWFFPLLTTDQGLRELDAFMQQYIRFCVTGRHYKGNYRIRYETLKSWGYRCLVHEWWAGVRGGG